MKGFASECLIFGGAFVYPHQVYLSVVMICVGVLSALGRYVIYINSKEKFDKILEAGEKIVASFTEASLSAAKESAQSQWEKVLANKENCN